MPITKQAMKKLRQDRRRQEKNTNGKAKIRAALKIARRGPTQKTITDAYRALDKGAKFHIIHPNKAARLKSRLFHLLTTK